VCTVVDGLHVWPEKQKVTKRRGLTIVTTSIQAVPWSMFTQRSLFTELHKVGLVRFCSF